MPGPGSDPFQLVSRGQPVSSVLKSADTVNAWQQAAADFFRRRNSAPLNSGRDNFRDTDQVLIQNNTEVDLNPFSVLWATLPLISPTTNVKEFNFNPQLQGQAPDFTLPTGALAITQEPIKSGEVGLAVIGGLTPASVLIDDEHPAAACAAAIDGNTDYLVSSPEGNAILVWYDAASVPGVVTALVLLPATPRTLTVDIGCPYIEGSGGAPYTNIVAIARHLVFQQDDFGITATNYASNDGTGVMDTALVAWRGLSVEYDRYDGNTCNDVKKLIFQGAQSAEFDSSDSNIFFNLTFDSTGSRCATDSCVSISEAIISAFAPTNSDIIYQYACSDGTLMASTKSKIFMGGA